MSATKKAWKLQDLVAHGADVKCLGLGHTSGQVIVTGGDDHKVNLWSVGKSQCILSLTGHTTSVEAVRFSPNEEMVAAGSCSGVLKVWDLKQDKSLCTVSGHRESIKSLDFHPYGNYVASGSADCCVKLWDIRRKDCIYTYKSHTMGVNCLRFTPDGHWIASASDDSTIKIWNLTAGKLITEFKLHKGPVNVVEFHPSDLLLASGSSDKTVKFWDLDSFQCISSSDADKQPVRCIYFHPEGSCLYTSCGNTLKVYGWEPFICHDIVQVVWSEVTDMAIADSKLIAASFSNTNLSTFVVDLSKVAPTGATSKSENVKEILPSSNIRRRTYNLEHSPGSAAKLSSEPKCTETPPERNDIIDDSLISRLDIRDQEDKSKICKELASNTCKKDRTEPFPAPSEDNIAEPEKDITPKPVPARKKISPSVKPVLYEKVKVLDSADFLPKTSTELAEREMTELPSSGHTKMITVLQQRFQNLQVIIAMWRTGNTKMAMNLAINMKDPAVIVDFLNLINTKASVWNLDLCSIVLPQLVGLMSSKYESHVITAGSSLKLILRNFSNVIKTNMEEPPSSFVDISREERREKCQTCYRTLFSIKDMISLPQPMATSKQTSMYREIMLLMAGLD